MKTQQELLRQVEEALRDIDSTASGVPYVNSAWLVAAVKKALPVIDELLRMSAWQPIEEYNREAHGNVVLVYDRLPVPARYDADGKRWMLGGYFLDHPDYFVAIRVNPTHFMMLPPQPDEGKL